MVLVMNVANEDITFGVYENEFWRMTSRIKTDSFRTEDQYAAELNVILGLYGIRATDITGAILHSVSKIMEGLLQRAIEKLAGISPVIAENRIEEKLKMEFEDNEFLGIEMIAGCAVVAQEYTSACIVLNLEEEMTMVAIDETKKIKGGCIVPQTAFSFCTTNTTRFSKSRLKEFDTIIRNHKTDAVSSGLVYGTACMIDGLCQKMQEELGTVCNIVATGRLVPEVIKYCKREIVYCENLLLKGLKFLYE